MCVISRLLNDAVFHFSVEPSGSPGFSRVGEEISFISVDLQVSTVHFLHILCILRMFSFHVGFVFALRPRPQQLRHCPHWSFQEVSAKISVHTKILSFFKRIINCFTG